jgi:hypothetical protein
MGVSELVVRSDGSIVVVDRGPGELRAFDATGEHLWSAGRRGGGPGEFGGTVGNFNIRVALLASDSLLTWDLTNRRLQVFAPDGEFQRSFSTEVAPSADAAIQPYFEGTLAGEVIVTRNILAGTSVVPNAGYMSPIVFFGFHDRDGGIVTEVGGFPEVARSFEVGDGGSSSRSVRLGSDTRYAVGHGVLAAGTQARIDIQFFGPDGTLSQILRVDAPAVPVDEQMREVTVEQTLAGFAEMPVEMRQRLEEQTRRSEFAEVLPSFRDLMLDAEQRIWVEEYVPSWENRTPMWTIFAADGALLARASIPENFTPIHIAEDRVVGVWLDELEVSYVHVRPITTGSSSASDRP